MIAETAAAAASILAPLVPYLVKTGVALATGVTKGASEAIGKAGGEATWQAAVRVWDKIVGKADERDGVKAAAQTLSLEPEEPDTQKAFARALKRLFEREPELAQAVRTELGGQEQIQEMLAENGGRLSCVAQDLEGVGKQSMTARNGGVIEDATQINCGKK